MATTTTPTPPSTPTPTTTSTAASSTGTAGTGAAGTAAGTPGTAAAGGGTTGQPITSLTRFTVWSLRNRHKRIDTLAKMILNYIWSNEIGPSTGSLFIAAPNDDIYLFEGLRRRMYRVDLEDPNFKSLLMIKYGLLPSEQLTKHVVAALRSYTTAFGLERDIRRFVHFSHRTGCLYVSRYNGTVWKLDGNSIEIIPNGAGVVFADDDEGVFVDDPPIGPHGVLQPSLVDDLQFVPETKAGLTAKMQKLAFTIWMHTLAFPDLMPTKPILIMEGERGSGKTSALQRVMKVLHGYDMPRAVGKKDEDDFGVSLIRTPICLLDNPDTFIEWLQDFLCTYATSGGWIRRKLFTDTGVITIRPQAFISIATRNPVTFRRADVADRSIVMRLEPREGRGGFKPLSLMMQKAMDDRPEIFGEWLYNCNQIVAEIRAGALQSQQNMAYRMADFAALAHLIGKALMVDPADVDEMLRALQGEREVLSMEGDPLIDLLDKWLEKGSNVGREITSNDLHKELSDIAHNLSRNFYIKSPSVLAQKLRDKALERHFSIKRNGAHGGALHYSFRRAEVHLEDDIIVLGNDDVGVELQ